MSLTSTSPLAPSTPVAAAAQSPSPAQAQTQAQAQAHVGRAPVRVRLWDLPLRLFHWSLVVAVLVAVISGQAGGEWMCVHGWAGLAVTGLLAFRVVWGFVGPQTARFAHFAPTPAKVLAYLRGRWQGVGHNPLGALAVFALLGLLAFQAGTGLFGNDDIAFTGPLAVWVSSELSARLTGLHHQAADVLLVLIGLHVVAIVFYAWFKKNNLVKPMITGYKEVATPPAATRSRRGGGWLALATALVAGVAAVLLASGVALPEPAAAAATTAPDQPAAPPPAW